MLKKLCRKVQRLMVQPVVKMAAKRPRQKITAHAPATTPLVKIPAVL